MNDQQANHATIERCNTTALLHNMSCRPTAVIKHQGSDQCQRLRFTANLTGIAPDTDFFELCHAFGVELPTNGDGWSALNDAANEPCPELLRMPAMMAVCENSLGTVVPQLCDNPRVILAVLTRSTSKLFIRNWTPVITMAKLRRSVTLLAPLNWKLNP